MLSLAALQLQQCFECGEMRWKNRAEGGRKEMKAEPLTVMRNKISSRSPFLFVPPPV